MSFVDRKFEKRPSTGEAPFGLDEVFFSRTDDRGVIQAGNYIFRRVSDYDWDSLLGAPHKLIRHPDMPKGVFWLLWDTLKRGEVMGAYVKNQAQDGLFYWVFAVIMPCEGGYLSARVKPSSPTFKLVKKEYAALKRAEDEQGLTPEDSAALLLTRLQGLGFANYSEFHSQALSEELAARLDGSSKPANVAMKGYSVKLEAAGKLQSETFGLISEFETMRTIPHNMRVIASRLEPTGGPVSTLSQNYGSMSQEISDWFGKYVNDKKSNFSTIKLTASQNMFLEGMSQILTETASQLDREQRNIGGQDLMVERDLLNSLNLEYQEKSSRGKQKVSDEAKTILTACSAMHRQVLGLSTTRVMCKIEGARIGNSGESLDDIISQLDSFQSRITARLDRIAQQAEIIRNT